MQENKNMLLMMKDTPVMRINTEEALYEILDDFHMPFQLKGSIVDYQFPENLSPMQAMKEARKAAAAAAKMRR